MRVFTIKKSEIPAWGYEITGRNFHNIAPTAGQAARYLESRFGPGIKIRFAGSTDTGRAPAQADREEKNNEKL